MWKRITSVAVTYVRQKRNWILIALLLLLAVSLGFRYLSNPNQSASMAGLMIPQLLLPLVCGGSLFVHHYKEQVVHHRARLTPHFFAPHCWMAGAVLSLLAVLFPAWAALCLNLPLVNTVAYVSAMTLLYLWAVHWNSMSLMCVLLAIFFGSYNHNFRFMIGLSPDSAISVGHGVIMLASWLGIVYWLVQFRWLTEDDPSYQLQPGGGFDFHSTARQRRATDRLIGQRKEAPWWRAMQEVRLGGLQSGEALRSAAAWRQVWSKADGMPAWLAMSFVGLVFFFNWLISRQINPGAGATSLSFLNGFGALVAFQGVVQRSQYATLEWMLPGSRQQLVGVYFGRAWRMTAYFTLVVIASGLILLLSDPSRRVSYGQLLAWVSVTVGVQFIGLGSMMWLTRTRQKIGWSSYLALAMICGLAAPTGIIAHQPAPPAAIPWLFALAAALAATGSILIVTAHRRWLEWEFG